MINDFTLFNISILNLNTWEFEDQGSMRAFHARKFVYEQGICTPYPNVAGFSRLGEPAETMSKDDAQIDTPNGASAAAPLSRRRGRFALPTTVSNNKIIIYADARRHLQQARRRSRAAHARFHGRPPGRYSLLHRRP